MSRGEEEEARITMLQERKQCKADLEGVEPYLLEQQRCSRRRRAEEDGVIDRGRRRAIAHSVELRLIRDRK